MRVTNSKTLYLSEVEMLEAVAAWLHSSQNRLDLSNMILKNHACIDTEKDTFVILIDGAVPE
tara:strand:+ start:10969 stop:11154 length:186 start_codon:yes stop_codon:yes gene_type:complete